MGEEEEKEERGGGDEEEGASAAAGDDDEDAASESDSDPSPVADADDAADVTDAADTREDTITLSDLLRIGSKSEALSSGSYSAAVHHLTYVQSTAPFLMVADGYNCYLDSGGKYYHHEYDWNVERPIPPQKITLFRPFANALGLGTEEKEEDEEVRTEGEDTKKRGGWEGSPRPWRAGAAAATDGKEMIPFRAGGGIVVAPTYSNNVKESCTRSMLDRLREGEEEAGEGEGERSPSTLRARAAAHEVTVTPYSPLETQHVLANLEVVGVGRLRFDGGETIRDVNEVSYLGVVSGGIGQRILDACIV